MTDAILSVGDFCRSPSSTVPPVLPLTPWLVFDTLHVLPRLRELVEAFVQDADPEAVLNVGADMRKINACFGILKVCAPA